MEMNERNASELGARWDDEPPGHHQHNHEPLPTVNERDYQSSSSRGSRSRPASFELEGVSVSGDDGDGGGWRIGMPWFRKSLSPASTKGGDVEDPSRLYYGGLMRSQGSIPIAEPSTTPRMMPIVVQQDHNHHQSNDLYQPTSNKPTSIFSFFGVGRRNDHSTTKSPTSTNSDLSKVPSFFRTLSHLTQHSTATGRDSLADFEDTEWTPPDSSYGAAIPVFGCIPKPVRRAIEFTMIALMIVGFVYLVVATSIYITNERNKSINSNSTSTSKGGRIALDDDLYVEEYRTNDDLYNQNNYDGDSGGGDDDAGGGGDDDGGYAAAANDDNGCYGDDCYSMYAYNDDDGSGSYYSGANNGYYYTNDANNNANDDYAYGGNGNRRRLILF